MSVGESGGSEGGASDEYDEEDEELVDPQHNSCDINNSSSTMAAKIGPNHLEQRMARAGSKDPGAATGTGNSFFFLNSYGSNGANAIRDEAVNNYYTSLLTGNCLRGHQSEPSLQTAEQTLKQIISDPFSGELMDDAIIFPCGHSFGSAGIQKIHETNMCQICKIPTRVADGSINLALRAVVHAFKHDRGNPSRASKRRRDHDEGEGGRTKGVQFPYVVSDKVLIKGNKRTPERFVGKQAIITTQCLNGWYLVRTLDNGECVRLQYRSLQKIEDDANWQQQQQEQKQDTVAAEFASVEC